MNEKTGLCWYVYDFSVDYDSHGVHDILIICKYLMENQDIENEFIKKKILLGLVSFCGSFCNKMCISKSTVIAA